MRKVWEGRRLIWLSRGKVRMKAAEEVDYLGVFCVTQLLAVISMTEVALILSWKKQTLWQTMLPASSSPFVMLKNVPFPL